MTTYVIYNDLHLYSPYELEFDPQDDVNQRRDIILLGDIIDLYNCKHSELKEAYGLKKALVLQFGPRYVTGNHELTFNNITHVEEKTLFIHGDLIYSDQKKFDNFRYRDAGAGHIKRLASKIWNVVRHWKKEKISEEAFARAVSLAKQFDCNVVVTGHQHPLRALLEVRDGISILCLPQGRHIVTISNAGIEAECLIKK